MTDRTAIGKEIEAALGEVVAHVRGEAALPSRIVDAPAADRVVALRKRLKTGGPFTDACEDAGRGSPALREPRPR